MLRSLIFSLAIVLTGCAPLQTELYSYEAENASEITLVTDAPNWAVSPVVSTEEMKCKGFKKTGILTYDAQLRAGGLSGALQRMNPLRGEERPSMTVRAPSNTSILIGADMWIQRPYDFLSCNPTPRQFTTSNGGKYRAYIGLASNGCFISITDLTTDTPVGKAYRCE